MRMPISSETRDALELLKEVQNKVRQTEDLRNNRQVGADLNALISVLESPVFQSILNIQDSLRELKRQVMFCFLQTTSVKDIMYLSLLMQVQLHPSILPADFDITPSGELVLNLPPSPADSFQNGYDPNETNNGNNKTFTAAKVAPTNDFAPKTVSKSILRSQDNVLCFS